MMTARQVRLLCFLSSLGMSTVAVAERADKDKPTLIYADQMDSDTGTPVAVYTGHASLHKGTILMRADGLAVSQDPSRYTTAIGTAQPGKLVTIQQKRDGVDEEFQGVAEKVMYDERTDTTTLFGHAVVKWLKAGRDANEVRADRITYNTRTEHFSAVTGLPSGASPNGRQTRTFLQPKTPAQVGSEGDVDQGSSRMQ